MDMECGLGHALKGLAATGSRHGGTREHRRPRACTGKRRIELRARVELVNPDLAIGKLTACDAAALLDAALFAFEQADDTVGILRASITYAALLQLERRNDAALVHLERAEAASSRLGHTGYADTARVMAAMRGSTSVHEGTALAEIALGSHRDGSRGRAYLLVYLAYLRALGGDSVAARETVAAARSELEQLGEELGLRTSALALIGAAESFSGDWVRMQEVFEEGLDYTRDWPDHQEWHAYFLARLGEARLEQGDPGTAADLAEQARAMAVATDVETSIWWRRVAARALAVTGDARKAGRVAREALALADDTDELLLRAGARIDLAEVLLDGGRRAEALTLVREGVDLLDLKGALPLAARAREHYGELLSEGEAGDVVDAAPPGRSS